MLQHEGEENRKPPASAAPPLTQDELSRVLHAAIQRHADAERQAGGLVTLEEALEIARQLDIPESEVLAAAEAIRRERELEALRPQKRAAVRMARRHAFLAGLAGFGGLGAIVSWLTTSPLFVGIGLLLSLYLAVRWLVFRISDAEADRVELLPLAGVCRVCGKPAITPRATFCEEHAYKAPGERE